jgi:peptidoglycan/LPS O-acetylase OafA/YrhL
MYAGVVNFLNQPVKSPGLKYKYNNAIEQYRGMCALLVMITHGLGQPGLLLDHFRWNSFIEYLGAGYLSVIIFFCISGYVIGITNNQQFNTVQYLKKRAIRLYPTYIISIILCIIIAGGVSFYILLGNVLFLQNGAPYFYFKIPVFINYATWSLNNEVLYYLVFIPLIYLKPKVWKLLLGLIICSILLVPAAEPFLFLNSLVNGFYLWMLGLLIGWNIIKGNNNIPVKYIPLLSILFLHLCLNHLDIGQIVIRTIGIKNHSAFSWLMDIPFCLMVMCILTGRDNTFLKYNKVLCYLLPVFIFIFLIIHNRIFENLRWIMCLIYWLLSLLFYSEKRVSAFIMSKLTGIGKISYGLYLLHIPVALLIKKNIFIHNQNLEVTIKYLLWLLITFSLSLILEMYLQPAVKKYFVR